jgi:hypothetical protein
MFLINQDLRHELSEKDARVNPRFLEFNTKYKPPVTVETRPL